MGHVQNIIADYARLEGTIRALSDRIDGVLQNKNFGFGKGIEVGFQCEAIVDFGAMYHQVYNHEELTKEFMEFINNHTNVHVIVCKEAMTGEDFGFMLKEIPGLCFGSELNQNMATPCETITEMKRPLKLPLG